MYCPGAAQCFPAGECDPGYYCPGSQTVANPAAYQCPIGFYCPQGTAWYVRPSAGYYTGQAGQDAPALCPAGYYCTLEDTCGAQCGDPLPSGNYTVPQDCPPGHYCPEGTSFAFEWPCPVGSYGPNMNLHNVSQCELCPPGRYCPNAGTSSEIAYPCAPGKCVPSSCHAKALGGLSLQCARAACGCHSSSDPPTKIDLLMKTEHGIAAACLVCFRRKTTDEQVFPSLQNSHRSARCIFWPLCAWHTTALGSASSER